MSDTSKARGNTVWHASRLLPVALAVAALLVSSSVVCGVAFAAEETYVVDHNSSSPCMAGNSHFTTIKAAVTAAASDAGVTIKVCPGTYPEQLVLGTPVTLEGVTVPGANSGAAIITVPSTPLLVNATLNRFPPNIAAQVLVQASNVTLSDLTINGTGAFTGSCSSNGLAGVDFDSGASGTMRHLVVTNQAQSPGSGGFCGKGIGIVVNQGAGDVTVRDSSISNYDLVGILALVPVDVENNVLRSAQSFDPVGIALETTESEQSTISSNNVVDDIAVGSLNGGGGILLLEGLATVSGNSIAVDHFGFGILDFSSSDTVISGNVVSGAGQNEAGIDALFGSSKKTVRNNSISALGVGLGIGVPAGSGDTVEGNTINGAGTGIEAVMGNTVSGNTFFNVGQLTVQ